MVERQTHRDVFAEGVGSSPTLPRCHLGLIPREPWESAQVGDDTATCHGAVLKPRRVGQPKETL